NSVFNPSPASTTNYWVRVSNSCAPPAPADSQTATVTVQSCQGPAITGQPLDQSVTSGNSAFLSVSFVGSNPITVTWFRGTAPDISSPAGSGQFFMTPALSSTTSFWAQITNSCGSVHSRTVVITVSFACTSPTITTNPGNQTVVNGTSVTLAVVA